ncbi:hypothetical protein FWH30_02605 [Microgenomates group bacterium]|nr:hypothetical protein [Microgenomates group bacterium]
MAGSQEISSSTQNFTEIFDIANDMVIFIDGSVSLVLEVGAMNFGLLAEDEQDAAIYAYAGLLNALSFPIEIVIRSHTKDVTNYWDNLDVAIEKANSDIKKAQIARYRDFVGELVQEGNVLEKDFLIVINANSLDLGMVSAKSFLPWQKEDMDMSKMDKGEIYSKAQAWLEPKKSQVVDALARVGLGAKQLNTQELVKLYYTGYNFADAQGVIVGETTDYTTPLVTTGK